MLFLPVIVHLFHVGTGVIYHLNETEYMRMPPVYTLDEYDSCMSEPGGVYCLAQFDLHSDSYSEINNLIKEYSEVTSKHFNHSRLDKGICVTKSCTTFMHKKDIQNDLYLRLTLEGCVNESIWKEYGMHAKLNNVYNCDTYYEESRNIDILDWSVAAVCFAILFVNLIASFIEVCYANNVAGEFNFVSNCISCFSIKQNWNRLMREEDSLQFQQLKGLHGVRSITMLLIIYAHMLLTVCTFIKDTRSFEEGYHHKFYTLIFSGLLLIQIFFYVTGFLSAYLLKIKAEETEMAWADIPKIIFLRWWRLTPANFLVIAFIMTWLRHMGSGPLWKVDVMDAPTATCRQYWWSHLLYVNNYVVDNRTCSFSTWYLAVDMQLLILGLVVHVATRRGGRAWAMGSMIVVGLLSPAIHVWLYDVDPQSMLTPEFLRTFVDDTFESIHILGHTNIACFFIGMAAGYLGYYLAKRGTNLSQYKICRIVSWLIIPGLVAIIYQASMYYADAPRASVAARMTQAATHRAMLGVLATSWMLGIICKCNDVSRLLFEWRGWELVSKLSYCIYLVHILFIYLDRGLRKQLVPEPFSYINTTYFYVAGLSFLTAVPLHLLVEAPFNRLLKLFTNQRSSKKNI